MALPSSGQLSYSQINVELGNSSTSQASMGAMAIAGNKSTTNIGVSNWYGYSHGSTILVDFYSGTATNYGTQAIGGEDSYKSILFSGRESGDIVTVTVKVQCLTNIGSATVNTRAHWSKNSTSSWTYLGHTATAPHIYSLTGIDYNDIIRFRMDTASGSSVGDGRQAIATIIGGSFTTGSGTITALGTTTWRQYVGASPF